MPNVISDGPAGPPAPASKQPPTKYVTAQEQQAALDRMNNPKPFTKEMMAKVMKEQEEEALANASSTPVIFPVHD
jgi:hypothetical protein